MCVKRNSVFCLFTMSHLPKGLPTHSQWFENDYQNYGNLKFCWTIFSLYFNTPKDAMKRFKQKHPVTNNWTSCSNEVDPTRVACVISVMCSWVSLQHPASNEFIDCWTSCNTLGNIPALHFPVFLFYSPYLKSKRLEHNTRQFTAGSVLVWNWRECWEQLDTHRDKQNDEKVTCQWGLHNSLHRGFSTRSLRKCPSFGVSCYVRWYMDAPSFGISCYVRWYIDAPTFGISCYVRWYMDTPVPQHLTMVYIILDEMSYGI
jgi:hypothetical protein